jgi:F-type H+-transporting ATPase subunit delta
MTVSGAETRLSALDSVLDELLARSTADRGVVGKIVGAVQGAPSASDIEKLPGELFTVVDALDSSVALRRALTDPSISEGPRQQLGHNLFDGKVSKTAVDLVVEAVAMRWAGGRSFTAALERQAVRAQLRTTKATWRTPRTSCSGSRVWSRPILICETRSATDRFR